MKKMTYKQLNIVMLLISLSVFLFLNNHSLLSNDEMGVMLKMRMPFSEMLQFLFKEDVHLPVYFILLKMWLSVFGNTVFAARCFSYAGLLACAVVCGNMVKRLYGEKAGVWYTALFLFLPISFWLTKTIRMYSWACFFCTAAFLSAQSALLKGEKKDFILYVIYAFLGAWTHYYASLTCAMIALAFLWQSWKTSRKIFINFFVCNALLFLGVCPQIYLVLHQNLPAMTWITKNDVLNADMVYFSCFSLSVFLRVISGFIMLPLWFLGFQFWRREGNADQKSAAKTGFFIALSVWGIPFVYSFLFRPFLYARYLTVVFGCLYVFFLFGILNNHKGRIVLIPLAFFVFFSMIVAERKMVKESVQPLFYQAVKENVAPNDVIVENDWRIRMWLYYYFPNHDIRTLKEEKPVNLFKKRKRPVDEETIRKELKEKKVFTTQKTVPDSETVQIFNGKDEYMGTRLSLKRILKLDK